MKREDDTIVEVFNPVSLSINSVFQGQLRETKTREMDTMVNIFNPISLKKVSIFRE